MTEKKLGLKEVEVEKNINKSGFDFYSYFLKKMFAYPVSRNFLIELMKKRIYKFVVLDDKTFLKNVQIKKYELLVAGLDCVKRNLDKGYISREVGERTIETLIKYNLVEVLALEGIKRKFYDKYKIRPPLFITLAPSQKCNLQCVGCYASASIKAPTLPYNAVDKIVGEVYNDWGSRFMVITGGEPLMYKSEGKTLFDIWEKYKEMYFLFYTNGTLINKEIAKKIAKLGNVTPGISLEGFEKETDERRGKGVFKKIFESAENLKEAGVPFGVSVTATTKNFDVLMDDKFYDYIFQEFRATYIWMFQLMPIGKAKDMKELMITPEQRVKLFKKWEYLLKEKKYLIIDFWNSGLISNGCVAYGREFGYLYIDWNGNVTPCVFVPYYEDNVIDLYKNGKKLTDALFSKLFVNGRKWQNEYGFDHLKNPDNWLMPCSIRDHYGNFKKNILTKNCKPEDASAAAALKSKEYEKVLEKFDKELEKRTAPIWKKEFLDEG